MKPYFGDLTGDGGSVIIKPYEGDVRRKGWGSYRPIVVGLRDIGTETVAQREGYGG